MPVESGGAEMVPPQYLKGSQRGLHTGGRAEHHINGQEVCSRTRSGSRLHGTWGAEGSGVGGAIRARCGEENRGIGKSGEETQILGVRGFG
jgi:hypothetical protein